LTSFLLVLTCVPGPGTGTMREWGLAPFAWTEASPLTLLKLSGAAYQ
jgi:hypothetical protein